MSVAERRLATPPAPPTAPSAWDRRDRRVAVLLFLLVLVVYLATATYTNAQTNDSRSAAIAAWSITHRGELALPDWRAEDANYWRVTGQDGRDYSNRFPGVIAWGVPFYAAHRLVAGAGEVPPHPYLVNLAPAGVAAATAAALAIVVAYALGRRLAERRVAVNFALVIGLATPFWSVAATALWPHAITSLMLLVTMLSLSLPRPQGLALAGSVAYAIVTRPHLAAAHGVLGLWTVWTRRWRTSAVLAAGGVAGIAALSLYTRLVFGTWIPAAGYDKETAAERALSIPWLETAKGVLLTGGSPERGVFVWTPFLILLVLFLVRGWRSAPDWARISAVAGIPYMFLQLRINPWDGGEGYGAYRVPIEMLVLAAPLLLATWQAAISPSRIRRRLFAAVVVVAIAMHAYGAIAWGRDTDDESPSEPAETTAADTPRGQPVELRVPAAFADRSLID